MRLSLLTQNMYRVQPKSGATQSDAALSCPACFTLVCVDCQQHAKYKTQYRAMFVMNCTAHEKQTLESHGTLLTPVLCNECGEYPDYDIIRILSSTNHRDESWCQRRQGRDL